MVERAHVVQVLDRQVHALADDALVLGDRWADKARGQLQHRVGTELGREFFVRQLDPVALDAGEGDGQRVALGADRMDPDRLPRLGRGRNYRLCGKVEGNAEDVGIFDVEQAFLVEIVGLTAQRAAHHLLA